MLTLTPIMTNMLICMMETVIFLMEISFNNTLRNNKIWDLSYEKIKKTCCVD